MYIAPYIEIPKALNKKKKKHPYCNINALKITLSAHNQKKAYKDIKYYCTNINTTISGMQR